jgi:hypothetical protein
MSAAIHVSLTMTATILLACGVSAPPLPSSPPSPPASTVATGFHDQAPALGERADTSAVSANNAAAAVEVEEQDAKGSPDLYGNEVSDAVARYRLDDAGSLYEVHSPQTELPRLAAPIS